jgi:dimethylargininase
MTQYQVAMLIAITRSVSPAMNRCELAYLSRSPIDIARAAAQHRSYEACLAGLGARVITQPAEPELPDSVFVEDPALVVDEVAVIARPGVESRRAETESLARALEPFRLLRRIEAPGTLEGGDIVIAGRTLFAGVSQRTNSDGIAQLADALEPLGYTVQPVEVRGCLHLKSGCCYLGDDTFLVNRDWIDVEPFRSSRLIDVAEPWAADVLSIGETVVMPDTFPATAELLCQAGFKVCTLDISELMKAEGGVTCMSLVFEDFTGKGII